MVINELNGYDKKITVAAFLLITPFYNIIGEKVETSLTLEEASRSVDLDLKSHIPSTVNYVSQNHVDGSNLKFLFSMYSYGTVTTNYGSTD